ncbi:MAG: LamG-like jellyroll fold domain-containing protein, partial [Chloroflexia bacterium]
SPPSVGAQYGYLDLSVKPGGNHQTLIHGNWDGASASQTWDSTVSDRNIANSYYLNEKPEWFGNLAWPPYDPARPPVDVADALSRIPAGYRLLNDSNSSADDGDNIPPTAPTGLVAVSDQTNKTKLNWVSATDNIGVAGYRVDRSQGVDSQSYAQIAVAIEPHFEDSGLPGGIVCNYRISAQDSAGNQSAYSGIASVTVLSGPDLTSPTMPTNLSGFGVGAQQSNIRWTASSDNVAVLGYQIERSQKIGLIEYVPLATSAGTTYVDTSLSPNTIYRYRVLAFDAAGNRSAVSGNIEIATAPLSENGAVAAFGFDEASGLSVLDSSGSANVGTLLGAARIAKGKYGGAVVFDGIDDVIEIPSSASLNLPLGLTLEAWIFPTLTQSSWHAILHKEKDAYYLSSSSPDGIMHPAGGGIYNEKEQYTAGSSAIPLNSWSHLATTHDGVLIRIYLNGVEVGARSVGGAVEVNGLPLRIGGNSYINQYFRGMIDEVRIYNRALTATEIQTDMNTPIGNSVPQPPSGLRVVPLAP